MAEVTDATFQTAVIERSRSVPVVIDLWAPWCGPCKQLTPILEKVVGEAKGLVELAKVNVDENPQVSQAFQVQSIPAVYAMRDGQVVDGFMGAQGEPEVVAFVQRLLDSGPVDQDGPDADSGESPDADATISEPVHEGVDGAEAAEPAPPREPVDVAAIETELEQLLDKVSADDSARERFLELLETLGPDHPETNTWRRRLASTLY